MRRHGITAVNAGPRMFVAGLLDCNRNTQAVVMRTRVCAERASDKRRLDQRDDSQRDYPGHERKAAASQDFRLRLTSWVAIEPI
jgi:hypothetical protein